MICITLHLDTYIDTTWIRGMAADLFQMIPYSDKNIELLDIRGFSLIVCIREKTKVGDLKFYFNPETQYSL